MNRVGKESLLASRLSFRTGWLLVALTGVLVALGQYLSPLSSAGSDPQFSLVVSRAILTEQTIRLDDQWPDVAGRAVTDHRIVQVNGHYYYYFPYGTSVLVTPFVAVAQMFGVDVLDRAQEQWLLKVLAAGISTLIFWVVVAINRCYLRPFPAWLLAVGVMLGSSLMSSLGLALWSLNLTILFTLLAVWLLVRQEQNGRWSPGTAVLLGALLFAAFFCRPTAAVFVLVAFAYLLGRRQRWGWLTAVTALLLLAAFAFYNQAVMGTWLPPYYLPERLSDSDTPTWVVLGGLLFSPSRGLFVFSPIFLWAVVLGWRVWQQRQMRYLLALLAAWLVVGIWTIARFDHWWGGFSYGPRLLADLIPAFVWGTAVTWQYILTNWPAASQTRAVLAYGMLAIISIYIHTYAGLYNPATQTWNGGRLPPHIDRAPGYVWRWDYPQFLATDARNCAKNSEYFAAWPSAALTALAPIRVNQPVIIDQSSAFPAYQQRSFWEAPPSVLPPDNFTAVSWVYLPLVRNGEPVTAVYPGWLAPDNRGLETACTPAAIIVGELAAPADTPLSLHLTLQTAAPQPLYVWLNGTMIAPVTITPGQAVYTIMVDAAALAGNNWNTIALTTDPVLTPAAWPAGPLFLSQFSVTTIP